MIAVLISGGITAAAAWLWRARVGLGPNPALGDHEEYRAGLAAPRPFCWRWLVPTVTRGSAWAWRAVTLGALVASGPALCVFLVGRGASELQAVAGVAIWALLPGIWERHGQVLYLVDAPALAAGLVAASHELPVAVRVGAALVAGGTRETMPILAAAWCGEIVPLVGLLAVPWWRRGGPAWRQVHLFERPWRRFARRRWAEGFSITKHVVPFGGAVAGFASVDWRVWLSVAVAAVPVFRSVDSARLLVQAAPAVIAAAVVGATPGVLVGLVALGAVLSSQWQA